MGIFGFLFRWIRETIQEQSAKNSLESKLGRKVSKQELYSLEAHLDAAQPNEPAPQSPILSQSIDAPTANKRSFLTFNRLIVAFGIVCVIFIGLGSLALLVVLPERTLNRYSPFTPSPPAGSFPAMVGEFKRNGSPDYTKEDYTVQIGKHFEAFYATPKTSVTHLVWVFNSDAEARNAFEAKKKYFKSYKYAIPAESDTRFVPAWSSSDVRVIWLEGAQVREIKGYSQKAVYEFEAALNNTTPAEVVEIKKETPAPAASENSLTVTQLLDEYKKDAAAADKKYKGKIITVSGTVEVSEKDKRGNWMMAFMRPGATLPKDGLVICSFEKSEESKVSSVKKGDSVTLRGKVSMNLLGSVMLEDCTKP